jgi:predicted enzyme related to lactoylglutathione lyase
MPSSPKAFVWYELMTTDVDAAEDFYGTVVGWRGQAMDQPEMRYTVMSAGEKMVVGLMPVPEEALNMGAGPAWVGYIHADDIQAATDGVRQAGGAVHREPADIPNIGSFSVVADPQGAVFMLFQPSGGDDTPVPPMTLGHVGWHELYASDWKNAFEFYSGQFGWTKGDALDMGPMGTYQLFAAGGDPIGGMMDKPEELPSPGWLFYFNVEAIDAAVQRVTDKGGQIVLGPMEVPGGAWIVQGKDPQGATFALVAPRR